MGRNKIKIEKIENERIRQVSIPFNTPGYILQKKKRNYQESNGIGSTLRSKGFNVHRGQKRKNHNLLLRE